MKREILAAIEEAVQNGARLVKACDAIGLCERRYRRWRKSVADNRGGFRENNLQRLSREETARIIECFTSEEYRDLPLNIAHAKLMDQGIYVASLSSCERVMKAYYQSVGKAVNRAVERRKRPEYSATGPNQVWCWDIIWLHSEVTGKYYYLYLIIDMYSRYIVGWSLHTKEDGKLAELLFAETIQKHRPGRDVSLLVHADNGKPMRSKDLKSLCEKLHVISSHSRPHTSNDNAFAESIFSTMKSRVVYPEYFVSIEDAERFVIEFVDWYNNEHLHSGSTFCRPAPSISATTRMYSTAGTPCLRRQESGIRNGSAEGKSCSG